MSSEWDEAFAALARDAGRARLAGAAEVRRRAGRRSAVRGAAGVVGVAVLVAGVSVGARLVLADGERGLPVAPPSVSATAVRPLPTSIPAVALLTAEDAHAKPGEFERLGAALPPPVLCDRADYPSESQAAVRASVRTVARMSSHAGLAPDDAVVNTVSVYRGDGAVRFLAEVRAAAQVCERYRVVRSPGYGDDSVVLGTVKGDGDSMRKTYLIVVRVGDAVTLVESDGYLPLASYLPTVQSLAKKAGQRLVAWRP
ncbi:hypothetical protein [Actinoplanes sp. L3-i22]|uniref:hypothetical protein n=1 Tax=Actinoplanes sp. L3-i22 TaxID=2836373 RepID=UPI001C752160|nr:hypothetical protein [Actinoplanes sp. L3-i22]BCY10308.1 hypothetical protein L3i22_053960 [Actinoplanes sp. L3-i22]